MSLKHVILGFLNYGPQSGYDLKKAFDNSVRHFWPADQSQIYRTLARLVEAGHAEVEIVPQDDRPDRKVYHLCPAGRDEFYRWLSTPLPPQAVRRAELIQIFFAGKLSQAEIVAILKHTAENLRQILAQYAKVRASKDDKEYLHVVESPHETFYWNLTLEYGVKMMKANLEWTESVIQRIQDGNLELSFD